MKLSKRVFFYVYIAIIKTWERLREFETVMLTRDAVYGLHNIRENEHRYYQLQNSNTEEFNLLTWYCFYKQLLSFYCSSVKPFVNVCFQSFIKLLRVCHTHMTCYLHEFFHCLSDHMQSMWPFLGWKLCQQAALLCIWDMTQSDQNVTQRMICIFTNNNKNIWICQWYNGLTCIPIHYLHSHQRHNQTYKERTE